MQISQSPSHIRRKHHHILKEIVETKQQEVLALKQNWSLASLQGQLTSAPPIRDFLQALQHSQTRPSLIAEVKKASPSQGVIRDSFDPIMIAHTYEHAGASCLSVLTDRKFFQGSFETLQHIRQQVTLPLLCKEFVIDPYQIYLARLHGADAVLLIAAILSNHDLQNYLNLVHQLGMNALVEVHTLAELDRVLTLPNIHLIGINNRNLQDFTVDLKTTQTLLQQRPLNTPNITIVSESGLKTSADLAFVASCGADAVLVGESLVKQTDIEQAVLALTSPS